MNALPILNALPIVGRELRQQCRRSSTGWLRMATALIGGLGALVMLGTTAQTPGAGALPGLLVFKTLSLVVFGFCLFEGVRQTSDCLSSEMREGTLGLLFLTDLRGIDVVLGKLTASSLGSFYLLMAVFPAMAIALPYGGVSGGEFWRTQLVLLNTLFFGLSIGMWASASRREGGRALTAGLTLAVVLTLAPLTIEVLLRRGPVPSISPVVSFFLAGDGAYAVSPLRFWTTALAMHGTGWILLWLAGRKLLQTWRDDAGPGGPRNAADANAETARWAPEGEPVWTEDLSAYRSATLEDERPDRTLIERAPAEWLAAWVPRHAFLAGLSVFLLALGFFGSGALYLLLGVGTRGGPTIAVVWLTNLLPCLILAFVASRPLSVARREGALELLLSTPLPIREIVDAHWKALWRQLSGPFKASCVLLLVAFLFLVAEMLSARGGSGAGLFMLAQLLLCASRIATGIAVCMMGLYFGLRYASLLNAVGRNLLWNVVVPWTFNSAFSLLIAGWISRDFAADGLSAYVVVGIAMPVIAIAYSVGVIRWSYFRLLARFRELALPVS